MTIKKIIEYVFHTPHNTNQQVLTEMLKQLIADNSSSDPDDGENYIIYDGGLEN